MFNCVAVAATVLALVATTAGAAEGPPASENVNTAGAPSHVTASMDTATPPSSDPLVARGKYVAIEADCMSCHTAPNGKPFAGGYPLKSPLGIIYGPNVTQDKETGIGDWSKADFEKTLRYGVAKDGSHLYPAMPYEDYTSMTAEDMDALWAYMRTVPAVKNTAPKNTIPFPFNMRAGLAVWQSVYFKPGPFVPTQGRSTEWNRGAYLVKVMGHCAQCHTPRNMAEALETKHALAGGQVEGWYAPDISGDATSELHKWSVDGLAQFLKNGKMPNNVKVVGPMQETVHDSLRLLKTADLHAMAVFLKDQPPIEPISASKVKWPEERIAAGKALYESRCATCHQSNGKGIAGSVPALAAAGSVTAQEPYNVVMAMLEGFKPQGTWGAMSSFADTLNDEQIADVTNYVRISWGNGALPNATPWGVGSWRKSASAPTDESHALLCPSLPGDVMQPALGAGQAQLRQAASSAATMSKLIGDYRSARPKSSSAQVVQALSTAYCRAVSTDRISEARMSAQIADFAQRVAVALNQPHSTT